VNARRRLILQTLRVYGRPAKKVQKAREQTGASGEEKGEQSCRPVSVQTRRWREKESNNTSSIGTRPTSDQYSDSRPGVSLVSLSEQASPLAFGCQKLDYRLALCWAFCWVCYWAWVHVSAPNHLRWTRAAESSSSVDFPGGPLDGRVLKGEAMVQQVDRTMSV
jgi:hypothetical protein